MTELSPRLGLPYIQPSQAQKHVTHNEALQRLDTLVQMRIAGFDATTPPTDPEPGACYALGTDPELDWAGQDGRLAIAGGSGWQFLTPSQGWLAWDETDQQIRAYSGATWVVQSGGALSEEVPRLGVATTPDTVNRLAVASDASLFTHAGADHRMTLNKAATGDTASLLFQSDWTGHAEMGLAGETAFSVKVSADGVTWAEAMRADPVAQSLSWAPDGTTRMTLDGAALHLDVPVTGAAVQSTPSDSAAGKLLSTGAFGLGADQLIVPPNNDLDDVSLTGFYRADVTEANAPTAASYIVQHIARGANSAVQMAYNRKLGPVSIRSAIRYQDAGAWSDWIVQYDRSTVLGSVSQAGGTPTGALIEPGSNVNGAYVRFADGTQICTHSVALGARDTFGSGTYADPYLSNAVNWTFPAAFVSAPRLVATGLCSATSGALRANSVSVSAVSATQALDVQAAALSGAAGSDAIAAHLTARGRWY